MQMLFAIAAGGATGALARHFMAAAVARTFGHGFPYGTLSVNVLGSFLMGVLITGFALKFEVSQELRGFLVVGLLGSYTTFSTFSLEVALLIERGSWQGAGVYILSSILIGVAGLFIGMWAGRVLL